MEAVERELREKGGRGGKVKKGLGVGGKEEVERVRMWTGQGGGDVGLGRGRTEAMLSGESKGVEAKSMFFRWEKWGEGIN